MKRTDIERMISLADDRYIDEIFQDKITGRRRNIFVTFAAVAAALAVVAGGIGYLVSTAGNADKITADNTIVTEVGAVDYSLYFQNTDPELTEIASDEWSIESAGIFCYFSNSESEYLKSVMPFDMSGFVNANCHFYYDHKDELKTISIYANDKADDSQENVKMLYIDAHRKGEFFPHLPLEKCKSMKRFDVDIYGFDFLKTDNTLGVLFEKDGMEYLIGGDHMSYDEIGVIMDSIIENGLWADRFDLSRAEMEYYDIRTGITLAEANKIAPFAGHVPNIENIGGMHIGSSKGAFYYAVRNENNEAVPASLTITYSGSDMDGGWNNEIHNDMIVVFYTDKADVKPFENIIKLEDAEKVLLEDLTEDNKYAFTIDCGNFMVNIETENCTDNELLSYITAIRIGASGITGYSSQQLTIREANNIAPFAGHIPQSDNIGSMSLKDVSYEEDTLNGAVGNKYVHIDYMQEEPYKFISLNYGTFREEGQENYVPLSEVYGRLESLAKPSEQGNADCRYYNYVIECGDFWIKVWADCTPAEMIKCVMGINGLTDYSYGEEATKQLNLSRANMEKPYAGYVPQCMTIGSMSLANVYTSNSLMHFEGSEFTTNLDMGKNIYVFYQSSHQANPFEYISLHYVTASPSSGTVVAFGDSLNKLESLALPSKQDNYHCNYYNFSIDCGDFYINVGAECTTGEMEQCIRGIWDSKDDTQYKITELSLDEARANPLTAGLVPQTNTIGDMSLENGICKLYDGERIVIKYSNPSFKYDDEKFNYYGKYLTASYTENDGSEEGVTVFDDTEPAPAIDINDNGVGKYKFTLDCGDIYIRVEALCNHSEMWEFMTELKNAAKGNSAHSDEQDGVRLSNGINLVDSTLSAANKIKPFAGYVPQSESFGSLKLSAVSEGYFDGNASPSLLHMVYVDDLENPKKTMTAHFYSDYKAVFLDVPKVSAIPLDDISPEKIKEYGGNSFIVDCGEFYILIGAGPGCTPAEVWAYVKEIKGRNLLTMDKVKELAKKGYDLTWSDFEAFSGKDVGSGLYIMSYSIEGTYCSVQVGGVPNEKPMYIYLNDGNGNHIDIRYESIDDFLKEKPFLYFEF